MALTKFHFALGPVQSFVSESRRTRDLWAGSFLISYLTAHAMAAVLQQDGQVEFPAVTNKIGEITDALLNAVVTTTAPKNLLGTIPNRFVAHVAASFDPQPCLDAVQNAWEKIAQSVWQQFVAPYESKGENTRAIWQRQIHGFWEMTWALGDSMDLLDRRKNWRTQVFSPEGGSKCMMMPQFQEISGHWTARKRQTFWTAISSGVGSSTLELRDGEELSAVALVKRFFPRIATHSIGWSVPLHYPSTIELAVSSWRQQQSQIDPVWCERFARLAHHIGAQYLGEDRGPRPSEDTSKIGHVDPALFFDSAFQNAALWAPGSDVERQTLQRALHSAGTLPNPYYAVLLMDGDHLGKLLQQQGGAVVSHALQHFTQEVPPVVTEFGGKLVYAGGDDVLALLPRSQAIACAYRLHAMYQTALLPLGGTISGTIIFAHMHAPLTAVIQSAHETLDREAKEKNGRDSLAFAVWNSGGLTTPWAAKWSRLVSPEQGNALQLLVQDIGHGMSAQFLFKIQDLERRLAGVAGLTRVDWYQLLMTELNRTLGDVGPQDPVRLHAVVEALLFLSNGYGEDGQDNTLGLTHAIELLLFLSRDQEALS